MWGNGKKSAGVLRRGAVVAGLSVALALTGCGDPANEKGDARPAKGETPAAQSSAPATSSPEPSPTSEADLFKAWRLDKKGRPLDHSFVRASSVARGAEQEAVAEAWFGFYEVLTRAYTTPVADRAAFEKVGTGAAVEGALKYAKELQRAGHRDVGGMVIGLNSVVVDGDKATVRGCLLSSMARTDANGKALQTPSPWYSGVDVLVREGGAWKMKRRTLQETAGCAI